VPTLPIETLAPEDMDVDDTTTSANSQVGVDGFNEDEDDLLDLWGPLISHFSFKSS
jgi:hypothetical protein